MTRFALIGHRSFRGKTHAIDGSTTSAPGLGSKVEHAPLRHLALPISPDDLATASSSSTRCGSTAPPTYGSRVAPPRPDAKRWSPRRLRHPGRAARAVELPSPRARFRRRAYAVADGTVVFSHFADGRLHRLDRTPTSRSPSPRRARVRWPGAAGDHVYAAREDRSHEAEPASERPPPPARRQRGRRRGATPAPTSCPGPRSRRTARRSPTSSGPPGHAVELHPSPPRTLTPDG